MGIRHYIGIGVMKVSASPEDLLIAANLGSCLGIAAYDPRLKVGGVVHCLLPRSDADPERARLEPGKYVDTGMTMLLDAMVARGSKRKYLVLVAVGGSTIGDPRSVFEIGKKNSEELARYVTDASLALHKVDLGGTHSRTLVLGMRQGEIWLQATGHMKRLYPSH